MGIKDRAENRIDDIAGRAKETAGSVTGDRDLENEGRFEQAKARLKDTAEDVKDGVRDVVEKLGKKD